MKNQSAFVSVGIRTPFVKSMTYYNDMSTKDLMNASLHGLVKKYSLQGKQFGDVALGALMNSSANWNLTRECVLESGLHPYTPGYNVQRACGTGLETAWHIAAKISLGQIEWGIAGGIDSNSDLPIMVSKKMQRILLDLNSAKNFTDRLKILSGFSFSALKPATPAVVEPKTGLSMGEHCEKMVKEWDISRAEQDELAFISHQNAAKAYEEGFYNDLIIETAGLKKDSILRADTTIEKLKKLKPAFDKSEKGTLTAGNSTPLTDGSSVVILTSEQKAKAEGLPLLARFVDAEVAAVDFVNGDGLLMAPTVAVSKLLERNNLKLQDFDYYEIHEAFAGQVLCTLKAWQSEGYAKKYLTGGKILGPIDRSKMNVKGGSLALGHPFAATGGRIVASLARILSQHKGQGRGLISICTAGGMGVAAILETV